MWKFVKNRDNFGQLITLKYDKKIKHKTILGGFCTTLMYGFAIGYFVFCLITMATFKKI